MGRWIRTLGRPHVAIGICDRCRKKFPLDDLLPDPNSPGLRVCAKDRDLFDPWRLPPRQPENIALPFARPDVNIGLPTPTDCTVDNIASEIPLGFDTEGIPDVGADSLLISDDLSAEQICTIEHDGTYSGLIDVTPISIDVLVEGSSVQISGSSWYSFGYQLERIEVYAAYDIDNPQTSDYHLIATLDFGLFIYVDNTVYARSACYYMVAVGIDGSRRSFSAAVCTFVGAAAPISTVNIRIMTFLSAFDSSQDTIWRSVAGDLTDIQSASYPAMTPSNFVPRLIYPDTAVWWNRFNTGTGAVLRCDEDGSNLLEFLFPALTGPGGPVQVYALAVLDAGAALLGITAAPVTFNVPYIAFGSDQAGLDASLLPLTLNVDPFGMNVNGGTLNALDVLGLPSVMAMIGVGGGGPFGDTQGYIVSVDVLTGLCNVLYAYDGNFSALGSLTGRIVKSIYSGRIFATTSAGLLVSDNDGATWSEVVVGSPLNQLAIGPSCIVACAPAVGLTYYSTDNGNNWNLSTLPASPPGLLGESVIFDSASAQFVMSATDYATGSFLLTSTDGINWATIDSLLGTQFFSQLDNKHTGF